MKRSVHFLTFIACMVMLTSCGMYVGSPPKTEVNEKTTTTTERPPDEVHVYTPAD